ncbi:MAG TPA: tripartite tricarboxylate transporter substrate binding protein [Burkholderiales bacterium]|nr:tripartite tricarboxylate transporter substrate binding protein [Burkholderiales bacterium]
MNKRASGNGREVDRSRRRLLAAFGATALVGHAAAQTSTQLYPAKPVRIIVPWPPGSATDIAARLLAQKLTEAMGQTFIVDNRPGATGMIGAELVAKATPDGYTLLLNTASQASNKVVFPKLPFDPMTDFVPVSMVYRGVLSLSVHPSLPVRTAAEFARYAKAHPKSLSFGTPGVATPHHLGGELLKQRAGIEMLHVPYKGGGPSVVDLVSGQIPVCVASLAAVMPFIKSGRVRVLAVMDPSRYEELPAVPALAETYPGFDVSGWAAMYAPAAAPRAVVERLNAEVTRILNTAEVRRTMSSNGFVASPSSPEALAKQMRDDIERWGAIVKSGVRFD